MIGLCQLIKQLSWQKQDGFGWLPICHLGRIGFEAQGELSEPEWPKKSFKELVEIAFRGRVIDRDDHPVINRLRGRV